MSGLGDTSLVLQVSRADISCTSKGEILPTSQNRGGVRQRKNRQKRGSYLMKTPHGICSVCGKEYFGGIERAGHNECCGYELIMLHKMSKAKKELTIKMINELVARKEAGYGKGNS